MPHLYEKKMTIACECGKRPCSRLEQAPRSHARLIEFSDRQTGKFRKVMPPRGTKENAVRTLILMGMLASTIVLAAWSSGQESAALGPLPQGSEPVKLDPAAFTSRIDNPYWPMAVGSRWVYVETDGKGSTQRSVVSVLGRTKRILGIDARVVHDVVTEDGKLVENTYDWYAQDRHGNVWYLGEDTKEYENGKLSSTKGSWQAGIDGGQPGIVMPARPKVGMAYRQEYYKGEAEDRANVLSLDEKVTVPRGFFTRVLMTRDFTPLQPRLVEHKFYARGLGPVLTLTVSGGSDRAELVRFTSPDQP
jgi:hypothetical protein